jgi:hypothetical protein
MTKRPQKQNQATPTRWTRDDFDPDKLFADDRPTMGLCSHIRNVRQRAKAVLRKGRDG